MKYVLIFIIVFAACWSITPIHKALKPIFDPIDRATAPMRTKIHEKPHQWAAKQEANSLLHKIVDDWATKKRMPTPSSFGLWMKENVHGENHGLDPWGSPYYFLHTNHVGTVGSRGPDKIRLTPDDIQVSAPLD